MRGQIRRAVAALALLGSVAGTAGAQSTGIISGRVVDQASQAPVVGATVLVVGTTRGAQTGTDGAYRIADVVPGAVQVRATRIGYQPSVQSTTVVAGQTTSLNFALASAPTTLEQIVVTATGEQQRVREQGNSIALVELPQERLAAVQNFSQAIAGQAAGVQVLQSGGTTGTGARVRIRGANSLSLSNEPLIIIDGVRVNSNAQSNTIGIGGQAPSRLNDINPEDIETIEILKGPAASGLYGTQAANGVIQITTRRGRSGPAQWSAWVEQGLIREHNAWPANYNAWGNWDGEDDTYCALPFISAGFCTQDSIYSHNPLEVHSPFRNGSRGQYGLSVSGGADRLTYYFSGELEEEAGIYRTSNLNRYNLRSNVRAAISDRLTATVTAGYLSSDLQLPDNDNNFLGYISNGLAGTAEPDGGIDGDGYDPIGPNSIDRIRTFQDTRRFLGSVNMDWRPLTWLQVNATTGLDLLNRFDNRTLPAGAVQLDDDTEAGERTANRVMLGTITSNIAAIGSFQLNPDVTSSTSLGFQYQREQSDATFAFGGGLAAGVGNLEGATSRFEVGEQQLDNRLASVLLTQQFAWRDRLYVSAGVRGDDNSAFGRNFGRVYYPSAQLSWVVSEEEFFPRLPYVSMLRVRGAYGQSGLRPGNRDAITYFNPVPVRVNDAEEPGITVGGVGDPNLRPERTTEVEGGVNAGLFNGRVELDFGVYNKQSRDALVAARTPPSAGVAPTLFRNLGSVRNSGVELVLNARAIDLPNVQLDFTLNHSENRNRLLEYGADTNPIIFGLGGSSQRHVRGYSLGGYWGTAIESFADTDGDGIVDEINYSDTERFLGHSSPQRMSSLQSGLTLFNRVRLSGLVDYRGGFKQYNASEEFRCAIYTCRGMYDASLPLEEQARAIAASEGVFSGFVESSSFVKLRELAVTYTVPERFAQRLNATGLSLTLAGQNLGTWSDYSGLDPEVNFAGQLNFSQADFLSQPQVRRWTARVNFNF